MSKKSFWINQPVIREMTNDYLEIPENIQKTPISLEDHQFKDCYFQNITKSDYLAVHKFLSDYYVECDQNSFRLRYGIGFLVREVESSEPNWCLLVKGNVVLDYVKEDRILGIILAKSVDLAINGIQRTFAAINFLCVHPSYRKKNLVQLLIAEMQRRVNLKGIYGAIFTGGIDLNFAFCNAKYYHKILDYKQLMESGYLLYPVEYNRFQKRKLRKYKKSDFDNVLKVYLLDVKKYKLFEILKKDQFANNEYVYVLEEDNKIIGFGSFYLLDSYSIRKDMCISTAYLKHLYGEKQEEILMEMVDIAYQMGIHAFNGLGIGNRESLFKKIGAVPGTGHLNYYFFNYGVDTLNSDEISLIFY